MKFSKQRISKQVIENGLNSQTGQGFVEYAIILIFVGIAVVLVVSLLSPAIGDVFSRFVAQAPVAPPSLLNYTPPPSATATATVDPNATNTPIPLDTPVPSNTPIPPDTPVPSSTPIPSDTPVPSNTPSPMPCGFGPHIVPSNNAVRIQFEDFRCGGAGVAFSDLTNDGGSGSTSYRTDVGSEGPDLENTSDVGGGQNVGWTRDNEWIEYEIEAPTTAAYTFVIRRASPSGNPQLQIRTTQGNLQADTATLSLGTTGGWQVWQDYTTQVSLFEGTNIVRFNIANEGNNYNYFDIQPFVPTATPTPVTPTPTTAPVTLTLYSNASHDGDVRDDNGVGNEVDSSGNNILVGDNNGSGTDQMIGIVSFDTSVIPANATITSVELRLRQGNTTQGDPFGDLGPLLADIGLLNGFNGNYALESVDFQAAAAANNVIALSEPTGVGDWSIGVLGSNNFNFINRDNFTQFKIHFQTGTDGGGRDRFRFSSGNVGSTANRPTLIITYTVP